MATEGDLVKMKNGRWARYQQVNVTRGGYLPTMLVAVELEPPLQRLLDEAVAALKTFRLCLAQTLDGTFSVQQAESV